MEQVHRVVIPTGTMIGFKIKSEPFIRHSGNSSDWSAYYFQFTVKHAVSYLTNHFDRGLSEASLVSVTTLNEMIAYIFTHKDFSISDLESYKKAEIVKDFFRDQIDFSGPLMESIGDQMENTFLIIPDYDEMECIVPHKLFNERNFEFTEICRFDKGNESWTTKNVYIGNNQLYLTRSEKENVSELAERLHELMPVNTSEWYLNNIEPLLTVKSPISSV